VNPNIKFEVFIHKVDGLSDDHKIGKEKYIQPLGYYSSMWAALGNIGSQLLQSWQKTAKGQYFPIQLDQASFISSLLYDKKIKKVIHRL